MSLTVRKCTALTSKFSDKQASDISFGSDSVQLFSLFLINESEVCFRFNQHLLA